MKREIRFCYRKIIGATATKPWEKMVFDDSHLEFRLQVQNYELYQKYPSYGELVYHMPQAKGLSARVTPSVAGYIQQLGNMMPDILNNLGKRFMRFDRFQFEIINSHFELKDRHQVGISFFSEPYLWQDTIGNYLIISSPADEEDEPMPTETLQLQPYLSIYNIHNP